MFRTRTFGHQAIRQLHSKPFYVTTPIFYVNAAPHVGHLYTLILADVLKRWHQLLGQRAILCTGTDEHGMKIQQAAAKAGIDERQFCDQSYQAFQSLADAANVDYDHFIRTSDEEHRTAVQHFWSLLVQKNLITIKKHEGWYSVSDESFYTEKAVHRALDPSTGRTFTAARETGSEVEWTSENNYHFRLSEMQPALMDLYAKNPDFVIPDTRMRAIQQEVASGLPDLSISRPSERLKWGIRVPGDESQTIYVWVDALINYLTNTNFPYNVPGEEAAGGWPADCHVIGKDIMRFHCVYWPALLMGVGLPPPRRVLTHAHWKLGEHKMSKSRGTVVNPFFALDRFGVDCMRWYLTLDGGIKDDSSYENAFIISKYKKGLQGGIGNLVSRLMKSKTWDIRSAVKTQRISNDELDQQFVRCLLELPDRIARLMEAFQPANALATIMNVLYDTNVYLAQTSPWKVEDSDRVDEIVFLAAESVRICGILLQPFMPDRMSAMLDMLGVAGDHRQFVHAKFRDNGEYGTPQVGLTATAGVLFPPVRSHF